MSDLDGLEKFLASSEIWSDKVILLHIKGTQRGGAAPPPTPPP